MKKYILLAILVSAIIYGCDPASNSSTGESNQDEPVVTPMPDNSMNSLDWQGVYQGTMPCADCAGIETTLLLEGNNTYSLKTKYLGKSEEVFEKTGDFKWDANGNNIQLVGITNAPYKYRVGENNLLQLDMEGKIIQGEMSDKYYLNKVHEETDTTIIQNKPLDESMIKSPGEEKVVAQIKEPKKESSILPVENVKWKLIEIIGQEYTNSNDPQKMVYFILDNEGNTIHGNGGCNIFNGSYELKNTTGIKFEKMISTMRACPDMEVEVKLLDILNRVDNYTIKDGVLNFNKAKMATLARFERIK